MSNLPNLMTTPNLTISLDTAAQRFRVSGGTFIHKERIASVPGSRFVGGGADYWTIPLSWAALKVVARLFPNQLEWTPEAVEWANQIWTGLVEPSLELRNVGARQEWVDAVAQNLPDGILPKSYQVAGALYLATAKRAMLFDEQGTGKMTQTALTLSLYPDSLPALIISPKGVVYRWQKELAKFGIASVVVDGSAAERRKQFAAFEDGKIQVLITSYALVSKHGRVAGYGTIKLTEEQKQHKELNQWEWATVVADECHRIKDPTAVQTRACWAVRENATYVWGLTGTPIEKNVLDLWALLHFIAPIEFPSKTKFIDLWVMTAPQHFGGIEILGLRPDTEQEFRDVTEWHWRRVLKGDDLPPRVFEVRQSTMDAKSTKAYKDMKKQLMAELDSDGSFETLFAENHMVKSGRLAMMSGSALKIDENDKVKMVEPSWKLDTVEEAMIDHPYPTIYWFRNRDLLHMFEERLRHRDIEFRSIHGDITGLDRDQAVDDFQNGVVDHILVTYGAGSEGTTLTRAPQFFRVQRPFSSIQDDQAPARNHRIGSEIHDQILGVDFVTRDTYEEEMIENLNEKEEAKQEVLRD